MLKICENFLPENEEFEHLVDDALKNQNPLK